MVSFQSREWYFCICPTAEMRPKRTTNDLISLLAQPASTFWSGLTSAGREKAQFPRNPAEITGFGSRVRNAFHHMVGSSSSPTPRPVLSRRRNGSGSNHRNDSKQERHRHFRNNNDQGNRRMVLPRTKTISTRTNSHARKTRSSSLGLQGARCMLYIIAVVSASLIVILSSKIGYESPAMTKFVSVLLSC